MRLIDADALFKDICDSINEMTKIGLAVDGEWLWAKLNDALENAPTIEPERKKGTITYTHFSEELWGQSAICNLCGCKWQIAEGGEDNFCPNCGADMRGENNVDND